MPTHAHMDIHTNMQMYILVLLKSLIILEDSIYFQIKTIELNRSIYLQNHLRKTHSTPLIQ